MAGRLEGKVALVTGGGRGIGRATAERFAREGARVVVSDLEAGPAEEAVQAIRQAGGEAVAVVGDVAKRADAQAMVQAAVEAFGRLDIVVNNAGITRDARSVRIKEGEVRMMSEEDWEAVLAVNLKGTWLVSQAAAAAVMIPQRGGRVINTASVAARGNIGQANYSASKAGVIGLTRTLALGSARYNITVNCVAPGAVRTRMTEAIPEKIMDRLLAKIPLGRMADPEEIAGVHTFLASDEAAYITGQVFWVDGGLTIGA